MRNLFLSLSALLFSTALAGELAVKVTVAEPAGVARKAGPASGGVPFKKGQVKDVKELALFDKSGKPVPAQFSKLAPYEDGSVQWALLDVLVDLPAKGKAEFVVKKGKAALPARALKISEAGGKITINTGAAQFVVNTANFSLLESVSLGGEQVAGPGAVEIADEKGKVFKAGKPAKVSWEYKGPVRATLRVDGPYLSGSAKFIDYTTRLTFWAGLSAVRIDHSIRNSNPAEGDDAKMKWATVSISFKGEKKSGDGRQTLSLAGDGGELLVTQRHTGGCFPGGGSKRMPTFYKLSVEKGAAVAWCVPPGPDKAPRKGPYGYGDGFFALADCAHKDTEVWLDFGANPAPSKARISKLHALADPVWISETGGLGYGRFGTLADEIATYKKWGWKGAEDAAKQAPARRKHDPAAYVGGVMTHNDSESDNAELGLLMYLRTGDRGWFDYGEAWARYYKTHAGFRTDGFEYDGFRHPRMGYRSKRKCKGQKFGWYGPKVYSWSDTRFCMCHFFVSGTFDYYCLTGDVDALEAGLDYAESSAICYSDKKNNPGNELAFGRSWGRQFKAVIRAWQATRGEKWKPPLDRFMQRHIKAPNRNFDGSGLYLSTYKAAGFFSKNLKNMSPKLKKYCQDNAITWEKVKGKMMVKKGGDSWALTMAPQSFEFAACAEAVARCAEVTGDPEMKKIAIELGRGARDIYWSKTSDNHGLKAAYVGFPRKGKAYDPDEWAEGPQKKSGYHARFFADVCARAYSHSGDKSFLDAAKRIWNRGSKWGYWRTKQDVPDDEVSTFASTRPPNADRVDIRNCSRLFYEAARAK